MTTLRLAALSLLLAPLAAGFKDPADELRVAIVVDMSLRGFDVSSAPHVVPRQAAAGEVIDLFAAAGLDAARLDISYDGLPVRR